LGDDEKPPRIMHFCCTGFYEGCFNGVAESDSWIDTIAAHLCRSANGEGFVPLRVIDRQIALAKSLQ